MSTMNTETLAELAIDALSQTAFMFADYVDSDEAEELPGSVCFACIKYSGPTTGTLSLAASEGFVRELASGLLGEDPEEIDFDVDGSDAFRELANIIGGSLILSLGGDRMELLLGLPEDMSPSSMPSKDNAEIYSHFSAEGERLEIAWSPLAA